jgi:hypothetical protein
MKTPRKEHWLNGPIAKRNFRATNSLILAIPFLLAAGLCSPSPFSPVFIAIGLGLILRAALIRFWPIKPRNDNT